MIQIFTIQRGPDLSRSLTCCHLRLETRLALEGERRLNINSRIGSTQMNLRMAFLSTACVVFEASRLHQALDRLFSRGPRGRCWSGRSEGPRRILSPKHPIAGNFNPSYRSRRICQHYPLRLRDEGERKANLEALELSLNTTVKNYCFLSAPDPRRPTTTPSRDGGEGETITDADLQTNT